MGLLLLSLEALHRFDSFVMVWRGSTPYGYVYEEYHVSVKGACVAGELTMLGLVP